MPEGKDKEGQQHTLSTSLEADSGIDPSQRGVSEGTAFRKSMADCSVHM